MRPLRAAHVALVVLAGLAVAGCGDSSSRPGWTYAPAPSATPVASGAASAEPSASAAASPSTAASPGTDGLEVTAVNIAFEEKELTTAADEPFSIHFVNQDPPGVIHDVDIRDSAGETLQDQTTVDGGEEVTYDYTPLAAGEYTFICSIHPVPAMTGSLTVE